VKKVYKQKRKEDVAAGRQVNTLTHNLVVANKKYLIKSNGKGQWLVVDPRDGASYGPFLSRVEAFEFKASMDQEREAGLSEFLKTTVEQLRELEAQHRFRDDFPTFSKFVKFIKKNKVPLQDLIES